MALRRIDDTVLTAMADAIREKTGSTEGITVGGYGDEDCEH